MLHETIEGIETPSELDDCLVHLTSTTVFWYGAITWIASAQLYFWAGIL